MIRIGVDCRPLSRPMSGIARYAGELLQRLVGTPGIEWVLYADAPLAEIYGQHPSVTVRVLSATGTLASLYQYHVSLPTLAVQDRLDVFWSPRHHLPLCLPAGIRSVVSIHDMTWKRFPGTMKPLQRWSERLQMPPSLRKADSIITISASSRADIARFYPAVEKKIHVIHCGATRLVAGPRDETLPPSYLLFVGTPEPRKNLYRLLAAYAGVSSSLKQAYPLVLAGGHGWQLDIEQEVRRLSLQDHVHVLGAVSGEQLGALYAHARALLMPSLYEGFGLPILEAFQFGVPVLTSSTSAMPEVAGSAGVLVDPMDIGSIQRGMESLLVDDTRHTACVAAIPAQLARFDWEKAARETLVILKGI